MNVLQLSWLNRDKQVTKILEPILIVIKEVEPNEIIGRDAKHLSISLYVSNAINVL